MYSLWILEFHSENNYALNQTALVYAQLRRHFDLDCKLCSGLTLMMRFTIGIHPDLRIRDQNYDRIIWSP